MPQRVSLTEREAEEMNSKTKEQSTSNPTDRIHARTYIKSNPSTRSSTLDYNKISDRNEKMLKVINKFGNDEEKKPSRHIRQNFVLKNIQGAAKTKKIEYDTGDELPEVTSISSVRRQSTSANFRSSWENRSKIKVINYNVSPQGIVEEHEEELVKTAVEHANAHVR